jgi:hypothetical protein
MQQYQPANGQPAYGQPQGYVSSYGPPVYQQAAPMYSQPQYIEPKKEKPSGCCQPGCCCCCIYSTCGKWVCAIVTLLFLAGLAVAGYFLFPRIPTVSNTNISVNSAPGSVSVSGPATTPTLAINFTATATVYNPNYITYYTKEIVLTGTYVMTTGQLVPAGSGALYNQAFPPMASTNIAIPYNLQYTATGVNDPVLQDLLTQCGILGSSGSPLKFNYELLVVLDPITFVRVPVSGTTTVQCPQQAVLNALKQWLDSIGVTIPGING